MMKGFMGLILDIQEILGHKSSKTTEVYTHVSNKSLSSIRSPLDSLSKGGNVAN
jgi:integrase